MSSPETPRTSVADRARRGSPAGVEARKPLRARRLRVRLAAWMRWLHVYVSMFSMAVVLFFSVTGLTLNHPDWFGAGAERVVEAEGVIDRGWLGTDVKKLEVVEHLRKAHGVRGALADFRVDGGECTVTFKGPGYAADAFIDRGTGGYRLTETSHGLVAVLNDLHKGRDTGSGWSVLIDASAVVLVVVSLSGFVLLFYLKLRRKAGLVVMIVGAAAAAGVYWGLVP